MSQLTLNEKEPVFIHHKLHLMSVNHMFDSKVQFLLNCATFKSPKVPNEMFKIACACLHENELTVIVSKSWSSPVSAVINVKVAKTRATFTKKVINWRNDERFQFTTPTKDLDDSILECYIAWKDPVKFVSTFNAQKIKNSIKGLLPLSDITICVDEYEIPVHKFILMEWSPVFKIWFQENKPKNDKFTIHNYKANVVKKVVKFMYFSHVDKSESVDVIVDMFLFADEYKVNCLKDKCIEILLEKLSIENVLKILAAADALANPTLMGESYRLMLERGPQALKMEELKEFNTKHPELFFEFFRRLHSETITDV